MQNPQPCPSPSPPRGQRPQGIPEAILSAPPTRPKRQSSCGTDTPEPKRQRPSSTVTEDEATSDDNPIDYWRKHLHWPQAYSESDNSASHLRARRPSAESINLYAPSDQQSSEATCVSYSDPRYVAFLRGKNIFLRSDDVGISEETRRLCKKLLEEDQPVPQHSIFDDDIFDEACALFQQRTKARLMRDIALLIVPSAEISAIHRPHHLGILVETVSERWSESIPLFKPRPKPDYSVGFDSSAFSDERKQRLKPFIGSLWDTSFFVATYRLYFPFLMCEIQPSSGMLEIADRQNAHSATIAVRAVTELFRLVKREKEINREILAFSISHDDTTVRIYGHYPVIDGMDTKYYRHKIDQFSFTARDGEYKWAAYRFTKNVYDNWVPNHFKRICSAIDQIPPDISFDVPQESGLDFSAGLSQEMEGYHLSPSESSESVAGRNDETSAADAAPDTFVSQGFKKPRWER